MSGAGRGPARAHWWLYPATAAVALAPGHEAYVTLPAVLLYFLTAGRLPRLTGPTVLLLGLALWATLSLAWTVDTPESLAGLKGLALSIPLFLGFSDEVSHRGSPIVALRIIAACSGLVAAGYLLFARRGAYLNAGWYNDEYSRYSLPFVGVNYTAYVIAVGAAATMVLLRGHQQPAPGRLGCLLALAAAGFALLQTETRGAQLGFVLAAVAAAAAARRRPWGTLRTCVAGLVAVLVLTVTNGLTLFAGVIDRAASALTGQVDRGLSGRVEVWDSATTLALRQPLNGYGMDGYSHLLATGIRAHNLFVAVFLGLGIVGLALTVLLLLIIFVPPRVGDGTGASATSARDSGFGAKVLATFLAASVPIWASGVWEWSPVNWAVLGLCAGISIVLRAGPVARVRTGVSIRRGGWS